MNTPNTASVSGSPKLSEILDEMRAASEEFLREAVVLSADYLETFRDYPEDATILGWEKARWLRALAAKQRLTAILENRAAVGEHEKNLKEPRAV